MKHIASCSFGKDSIATVILAHLNNEPLDLIVYSEVMFDKNISGEHPLHRDFIYDKAIPTFKSWGYDVKILRSEKTYLDCFYTVCGERSKYTGNYLGFPIPFACIINNRCKITPLKKFKRDLGNDVVYYIGIATDEPKRLERLKDNRVSLLAKYNYTESMALELCKEYDLLSPIYSFAKRNGCWFCPNCRQKDLMVFKRDYPTLWGKLKELSKVKNVAAKKFNRLYTFDELDRILEEKINAEKFSEGKVVNG